MAALKNSSVSSVRREKDDTGTHVEVLAAERQGSGHPAYYEKNGLRSYGDDEDHDVEPPVSLQYRTTRLLRSIQELTFAYVLSQDHEFGGHGVPLDW
jgi:hypothetical protein